MKVSQISTQNNDNSFKGVLKKSPLVLKTLEKFELEDLIALKEVLDRAKNVNDGKVFDIFEYEKNKIPQSRGFYILRDFKEVNSNETLLTTIVEDYSVRKISYIYQGLVNNILRPLNALYPKPKHNVDKDLLKEEIKTILKE